MFDSHPHHSHPSHRYSHHYSHPHPSPLVAGWLSVLAPPCMPHVCLAMYEFMRGIYQMVL
ncbi:MAG: hypothetical protein MJE68_05720 [Proteobacteria bacterium]|nr:hypothetical protein [Pseudomonadota bacterium]